MSRAVLDENATDAMLMAGIRSGDQSAMSQLYDRYSGVVYAVALRIVADTGTAEDVLQEVLIKLWRNPETFDATRGSLGGWLAAMARNRAIDMVRRRRPETEITDAVAAPDMSREADRGIMVAKIRNSLGSMPPTQRVALEMSFFEGLTHSEIAEKTGEPLGTIKTRIRAGLLALRKACTG